MTLTIELTRESEEKICSAARQAGINPIEYAKRLIDAIPLALPLDLNRRYSATELLKLAPAERSHYLRVAADRAANEYELDLIRPAHERDLTAFSAVSGNDYLDGGPVG